MYSFPQSYHITTSPSYPNKTFGEFIFRGDDVDIARDSGWRISDSLLIENVYENTYIVTNTTRNVTLTAFLMINTPHPGPHDYE
jgi:hypothetical protein